MKYIIANWKANKNINDAHFWVDSFLKNDFSKIEEKATIIICPPYPLIPIIREKAVSFPFIKIGGQDISVFEWGPFTGEVTAKTLFQLVDYTIIGHSERRKYFREDDQTLFKKFSLAKKYYIIPLFCVRNENDFIPENTDFVVYEPETAISNGTGYGANEKIENVLLMKTKLIKNSNQKFIYGGSVNEKNASTYLNHPEIDGVMVGGASLDPSRFFQIISVLNH